MSGRGGGGRGRGNNNPLHTGGKFGGGGGGRHDSDGIGGTGFKKKEFIDVKKRTKEEADAQDAEFGFEDFKEGPDRLGWLVTYSAVTVVDNDTGAEVSGVDYYFIQQDGSKFKVLFKYNPYFYVVAEEGLEREVESVLRRKFADLLQDVVHREWWDLDLPNHLAGHKRKLLQLKFRNVKDLMEVRKEINALVQRNIEKKKESAKGPIVEQAETGRLTNRLQESVLDALIDVREYDVPYVMRAAIDNEIFVGLWYEVSSFEGHAEIRQRPDLTARWGRAEPRVLAFDIECTKEPLKFPDANIDSIYMISYMIDGEGFLIVNREIVSEDIEDFDYTPKKEYEGPFTCINVPNELALLKKWIEHVQEVQPLVFVTYNGDFFDWPFVDARMKKYGLDMEECIGMQKQQTEEYGSRFACHLDAFHWVNRDSYLPQGSRGLKSVTKHKLGYDPVEISPEDMLPKAREAPQEMASYSVSDAVATYYLYMQYVHPFIFSLCNIIPMTPGDVLRKGSGTLCETLLQVEAYRGTIVCPNKYKDDPLKSYNGHLIESETYVGGHVEALNSGVFRDDFLYKFTMDPDAFDELIGNLDRDLKFAIENEGGKKLADVEDYDEQKQKIIGMLRELQATPRREERPSIYHLDVAAMYPNIILTNRLQPPAMVTKQTCASCDFYHPEMKCRRDMEWQWRGEYFPTSRTEVLQLTGQLKSESENFEASAFEIKKRVKDYSQKVYKRTHDTVTETRTAHICQRENSFYIDTVKAFRDRRYEYKGLTKKWNGKLREADAAHDAAAVKECKNFVVLYDSLQLAHKCILNSFYGYVMRKGARWYSMEMAGVVTHKGGNIIRVARQLVERIGIPLELDTDGIWCCLPKSFPDGIEFKIKGEKKPFVVSYPCSMLNAQTHADCTNDQYHNLVDPEKQLYTVTEECSILFELDGPYKAMILPAAKEEGKRLKKRYAVFNFDGSLAELKGFELKRRGELQLVKSFQAEVFKRFLDGATLEECYGSVAASANQWLDILDNKGVDLEDEQLIDLISESTNMSKTMEEYGDRKSMAITTAKRMAQFLGADMIKDKGLSCKYVVARQPEGTPVTERAIPVEIFKAEASVQMAYLKRWCECSSLVQTSLDVRSILDWQYYRDRLSSSIQKIVTIPAAMQLVSNPVPRVAHPDWLIKTVRERMDPFKQNKIDSFFSKSTKAESQAAQAADFSSVMDIEMMGGGAGGGGGGATVVRHKGTGKTSKRQQQEDALAVRPLPPIADNTKVHAIVPKIDAEGTTMYTDFEGWHAHMRVRWMNQRAERKRRAAEDSGEGGRLKFQRRDGGAAGVRGFFQSRHHSMLNRHWEVLQISETATPGIFRVWAILEDGSLQALSMEVPRVFYVNYRNSDGSGSSSKGNVTRKLPFGQTCYNLERQEMSEADYLAHSKEISSEYEDPSVEGLYETHVPLLFRAIIDMGCVCSVNRRAGGFRERVTKRAERPDVISLSDLKFENTTSCTYLPSRQRLRKLYVYHSFSDSDGGVRGLLAVFAPLDEFKCTVFLVNRYAQSQRPPLQRFLKEHAQESMLAHEEGSAFHGLFAQLADSGVAFDIQTVTSQKEAWEEATELLKIYQEESKGTPSVLMVQSAQDAETLVREYGSIFEEFPLIEVPFVADDNAYEPLGWESKAGRALISNYVSIEQYYAHLVACSRYSHIPMANLRGETRDESVTMSDVLFARLLANNNHVLWASPGAGPDMGTGDMVLPFDSEEGANPELNFPAGHRTCCVTMDVLNLPLTAVVHSKEIEDVSMYGDRSDPWEDEVSRQVASGMIPLASTLVDETTLCNDAFKMLQYMADQWVKDAKDHGNHFADNLQMNMWRWINNPRSLFYAPAMQKHVHRIVKRAFGMLVSRLRTLGADILQASLHQLILCTNKTSVGQAEAYVEYLMNEVREVSCFELLQLIPSRIYARLLYMDRYNMAGLMVVNKGSPEEEELRTKVSTDRELLSRGLAVHQHWDIAQHLPRKQKRLLLELVAEFLSKPMKFRHRLEAEGGSSKGKGGAAATPGEDLGSPGFTQQRRKIEDVLQLESAYIHNLFRASEDGAGAGPTEGDGTPYFSKRLYDEISKELVSADFPHRPGSFKELSNPHLELLKQVCHIFGLEAGLKADVDVMKRGLLKVLAVREFAEAAQFANPSRSLVLPDLFCHSSLCAASRDVDLCREADFVEGVARGPGGEVEYREARCHACTLAYDQEVLEQRLVQVLHNTVRRYAGQDLRCKKCHRAASMMMAIHCECSGTYELTQTPKAVRERIDTLEGVADYYGFGWLTEELRFVVPRGEAEEEAVEMDTDEQVPVV